MAQVSAQTTNVSGAAPQFKFNGGLVEGYAATVQSTAKGLSETMSGMTELGSFGGSFETMTHNLKLVMQCHSDALHGVSQGLLNTAQSFLKTDSDLAGVLKATEAGLEPFSGYEVPVPKPPTTPPDEPWYQKAWDGVQTGWRWVEGVGVAAGAFAKNTAQTAGEDVEEAAESPVGQDIEQLFEDLVGPFL